MKAVFTHPDILLLAAIYQLMFQHFKTLCSHHYHTLQHLNEHSKVALNILNY